MIFVKSNTMTVNETGLQNTVNYDIFSLAKREDEVRKKYRQLGTMQGSELCPPNLP